LDWGIYSALDIERSDMSEEGLAHDNFDDLMFDAEYDSEEEEKRQKKRKRKDKNKLKEIELTHQELQLDLKL
jgi:hypothetical protein